MFRRRRDLRAADDAPAVFDLEPRLLAPHVAPLPSRLESILGQEGQGFDEIAQRIHLARIATGSRMPATYLLGIYEMLKMRDQGKEIHGDSDDGGSDGRADDSDAEAAPDAGADENDPESDDPVLDMGKNIFALKIILPRTIKLGQQQRATVARVPLGRFVQSMICARLFGRNVGVKALLGHPGRTRT